ncbi:MAG TPA: hypothetical protein PKA00_06100 [Saprospiraceae bacterium]|nr:hypothetical protein [Saprospiraceae bacterium]HMQ82456.1 hypothetical protein [Saprospiraceae bacterium]
MKIIIISSKGHWMLGWFTSPPELEDAIRVMENAGIEVAQVEVDNVASLERTLDAITEDTIVWPNAYFVGAPNDGLTWIGKRIEARGLPFIGSGFQTLKYVLKKDDCQSKLAEHHLPIPPFMVIKRKDIEDIERLIEEKDMTFPVVLKPTGESGSIGVCKADHIGEAIHLASKILMEFPNSDVILEEFLPSDDITCGFLEMGGETMLLPTYYMVKNLPGNENILTRKERLLSWDEVNKTQINISAPEILNQLITNIPKVVKALGVKGVTRIDGRLDKKGILRFFDVNGFPALSFPDSVLVKQCITCFPHYLPTQVFEGLIHTMLYQVLWQNDLMIPDKIKTHNLFTMESEWVLKSPYNNLSS